MLCECPLKGHTPHGSALFGLFPQFTSLLPFSGVLSVSISSHSSSVQFVALGHKKLGISTHVPGTLGWVPWYSKPCLLHQEIAMRSSGGEEKGWMLLRCLDSRRLGLGIEQYSGQWPGPTRLGDDLIT